VGPVAGGLRIDGRLHELSWRDAAVAIGFLQAQPSVGAPAVHGVVTRFSVLFFL